MVDANGSDDVVRTLCEAGRVGDATTAALRVLGPEILGFLRAMHSEDDAADVFAEVSERLWRTLPSFRWECSLRTWIYVLARNASHRARTRRHADLRRQVPASAVDELPAAVRTETMSILRTENRTRLDRLRESLDPDDRALLVLRVDRALAWNDVARAFLPEEPPPSDEVIVREAARLRKRFQLVRARVIGWGREQGLIARRGNE